MNEVNTAKDGRPDVEVRGVVTLKVPRDNNPANTEHFVNVDAHVRYSAHCRFCTETAMGPDPRSICKWADDHEASEGHRYSKAEALEASGRGTGRPIVNTELPERPPMDTPWHSDKPKMPPLPPRKIKDQPQA